MEYELFNEFVQKFLVERKDFLSGSDKIVLTPESIEEVFTLYVDNPIEGSEQSFGEKLGIQFRNASEKAKIVFAHASWLYTLGTKGMTATGKMSAVRMSLVGMPDYRLRTDIFQDKEGIADPGTAYGTMKPTNLRFLIFLFKWIKGSQAGDERSSILKAIINACLYASYENTYYLEKSFGPEKSRLIVSDCKVFRTKSGNMIKLGIYNFLLNLCDPNYYERLVSSEEKRLIAERAFKPEYIEGENIRLQDLNADDKVYYVAKHFKAIYPDLDPRSPLRDLRIMPLWQKNKPDKTQTKSANTPGADDGKKRYWLFAPGDNAKMWDEFYAQGYMAIGWYALGDLDQYGSLEEITAQLQEISGQDEIKKTNDALANWQFKTVLKPGDVVIVKQGRKILLGYGEVTSEYYFDSALDHYQKCRKVDWKLKGVWPVDHSLAMKTFTDITKYASDHPDYTYYYQRLLAIMGAFGNGYNPLDEVENPEPHDVDGGDVSQSQFLHPLNLILYGPPGTGKTYNTINKAVAIADGISDAGLRGRYRTRKALTGRYRELVNEGRIVFTTFHQSMSYEDFIEGIKPITRDDGSICYEVLPGIFKSLCEQSSQVGGNYPSTFRNTAPRAYPGGSVSVEEFSKLFDVFLQKLPPDSETERSSVILYSPNRNNPFEVFRAPGNPTVVVRAGNERYANPIAKKELVSVFNKEKEPYYSSYEPVLIEEILKLRGTGTEPSAASGFDQAYARLCSDLETMQEPVMKVTTPNGTEFGISLNSNKNLTVNTGPEFIAGPTLTKENLLAHASGGEVPPYDKGYFLGVLDLLKSEYGMGEVLETIPGPKKETYSRPIMNYILIIDEINRGNVSQIFGELITLIEEDKRKGAGEALEIKLPYSGELFSVPPNLHIIGTMNTADRSIEALDTALRRRFTFQEMLPLYEVLDDAGNDMLDVWIAGHNLSDLLRAINHRIEILLDRDHQIGHSYFLGVKSTQALQEVFENKVIPLLQEYFFGDYGKIGLVLGPGFVERATNGEQDFSGFDYDEKESLLRDVYRIKTLATAEEFEQALETLF